MLSVWRQMVAGHAMLSLVMTTLAAVISHIVLDTTTPYFVSIVSPCTLSKVYIRLKCSHLNK